jgi:hypothetical protein
MISNLRVRFAAYNRLKPDIAPCPKCANRRLMHYTNFDKKNHTHIHGAHVPEEPSTVSTADISLADEVSEHHAR